MSEKWSSTFSDTLVKELLRLATLAPSGHNSQPWSFSIDENIIRIFPDLSRRLPAVDPDDHALYVSIGCALENLVIAARHFGFSCDFDFFPSSESEECIVVTLQESDVEREDPLFQPISERQVTRCEYDGRPIPAADLGRLDLASRQECVTYMHFEDKETIDALIEFVKEGNQIQLHDKAFVNELISWIRFNRSEVEKRKDGLASEVMGFPNTPRWLGNIIMKHFVRPEGEVKRSERMIRSSSGLLLFTAESNNKHCWVNVGRSYQRVALTATALGIKHAHINMPCEVLEVREKLKRYLGLEDKEPLLLLRVGYAEFMPRSQRRPLDEVMRQTQAAP